MKFVRLFILGLSLVTLSGMHTARAGDLEVEFWTTETEPARIQRIEYLMNAFAVLNDGVRVDVIGIDENSLLQRFDEAEKSGRLPVLIDADSSLLKELASRDKLDARAIVRVLSDIGESRFFQAPLRGFLTDDAKGHFAVPFHGWVQALWYRADWFRAAGLEHPDNFAAILKAAEYFNDPEQDRYGIVTGTAGDLYEKQIRTQLARADGADMAEAGSKAEAAAWAEADEFYRKLQAFTPPGPVTVDTRAVYLEGRAAMIMYSSFMLGNLAQVSATHLAGVNATGDADHLPVLDLAGNTEMRTVIMDKVRGTYGVINGLALTHQSNAEMTVTGQKMIAFILRSDVYVHWLHMAPGGMLPVLRDVAHSKAFYRDPKGIFRRFGWQQIQSLVNTFDEKNLLFVENISRERRSGFRRAPE
ncbi:MAG: ABC transporter substrate-binding protein [Rhodospirillales bacterium]